MASFSVGTGPSLTTSAPQDHAVDSAHSEPLESLLERLATSSERGLEPETAADRLHRFGPNELSELPPPPWWRRLAKQFKELVIWILIVAAIVSGAVGEWTDTLVILAIVAVNGALGFLQEERASRALAALKKLTMPHARVLRAGLVQLVPAREIVPGDRIELDTGDYVTADVRLFKASALRIDESSLTGESSPVEKSASSSLDPETALADRTNMAWMGTVVSRGKGSGIVVATGMGTQLGLISGLLQHHDPEPTPLQRRLAELGKVLAVGCVIIAGVIFLVHVLRGSSTVDAFLLAVSLAVAAVPEGLPAVVTIALALGVGRMARRHALVRNLPSVETLGSVTVICTDKTGTLTRNEMTVREVAAGGRLYDVTGGGYGPEGKFLARAPDASPSEADGLPSRVVDLASEPDLLAAMRVAAWCNHASVRQRAGSDRWEVVGDPTEGALVTAARKAGIDLPSREAAILHELPFDSERKMMSILVRVRGETAGDSGAPDRLLTCTKGAAEVVIGCCTHLLRAGRVEPITDDDMARILWLNSEMGTRALRVLALAYREDAADDDASQVREERLVLAGLTGMIDPPREQAKMAVARCKQAGIRAVMITGDHPDTAIAIARELGIVPAEAEHRLDHGSDTPADEKNWPAVSLITGPEIERMSDVGLNHAIERASVFARVTAEHKLRLVRAYRAAGEIVAMTGDGVNDAPAVKSADIGIAMGAAGTDVTREAADMVLTDDDFSTIISAVEEGRGIFDNIRRVVHYLLSCNVGEVLFMLWAALAGWRQGLHPIQLLWINLVTDGLPALALGIEPPEPDAMDRPPKKPRTPVITIGRGTLMLGMGLAIATATACGYALIFRGDPGRMDRAQTVAFCIMSCSQLFFSLSCRSQRYTLPQIGFFSNRLLIGAIILSLALQLLAVTPPLAGPVFKTVPPSAFDCLIIVVFSLAPTTLVEVGKLLLARRREKYRNV